MLSSLVQIQNWFASQCNDEWEHEHGIVIETIDNPGWHVRIALARTTQAFNPIEVSRGDEDWYQCRVKAEVFEGFGGATNLSEILNVFVSWTEGINLGSGLNRVQSTCPGGRDGSAVPPIDG